MALLYPGTTLTPTKLEVLRGWLADADWFDDDPSTIELPRRSTYRFDDPAGAVGIETLVASWRERLIQLPLTYRDAPLAGAEQHLLTTMEHGVPGRRWCYLGLADPVAVTAFVRAVLAGEESVPLELEVDGERQVAHADVTARGTGTGPAPDAVELIDLVTSGPTSVAITSAGVLTVPHVVEGLSDVPLRLDATTGVTFATLDPVVEQARPHGSRQGSREPRDP